MRCTLFRLPLAFYWAVLIGGCLKYALGHLHNLKLSGKGEDALSIFQGKPPHGINLVAGIA